MDNTQLRALLAMIHHASSQNFAPMDVSLGRADQMLALAGPTPEAENTSWLRFKLDDAEKLKALWYDNYVRSEKERMELQSRLDNLQALYDELLDNKAAVEADLEEMADNAQRAASATRAAWQEAERLRAENAELLDSERRLSADVFLLTGRPPKNEFQNMLVLDGDKRYIISGSPEGLESMQRQLIQKGRDEMLAKAKERAVHGRGGGGDYVFISNLEAE